MESPPSNPFSSPGGNINGSNSNHDGDETNNFDTFGLSPVDIAKSSPMPSLQSIHLQEQQMQQQQQGVMDMPSQLKFDSIPSPEELSGPMNNNSSWPPPPPVNATNFNSQQNMNTNSSSSNTANYGSSNNGNGNRSFLSKVATCGGICSLEVLRPYFDVDTVDILVRMKGTLRYLMVNDGFRNEVLYSDNAVRLAYRDTEGSGVDGNDNNNNAEGGGSTADPTTAAPPSESSGKGPDLYGPIWITLTLVFFVAVTSNMSLYLHHRHESKSIVDEGGIAAEREWDYDVNQLLHATWILYSFSIGLPTMLYFVLRLANVNNLGLAELICLYGYSLVPFLPVTFVCIAPSDGVKWFFLLAATALSGMMILRNVAGSIMESEGGAGGGLQGNKKSGGLVMCLVGCHFVFFLVMKLVFYHHD